MADPKKVNGAEKEPFQVRRGERMRLREQACNDWLCIVDSDIKAADLTKPDVFALVGKELQPRDCIRVFPIDHSYMAELVVLDSGMGWAEVALLRSHDLPKVTPRATDILVGFELVQDGVDRTWYAIRKLDRQELGKGHVIKSKKDLIRFVEDHASTRR